MVVVDNEVGLVEIKSWELYFDGQYVTRVRVLDV
jgi:hypothetical protein